MSVNNTLLEKQQALVALSSKYLDCDPADFSYQEICDDLLHLSGAAYAVVNVLLHDKSATKTVAISGLSKNLQKASEIFGFNPLGKEWPVDEFAIATMRSSKLINQGDIEIASTHISRKIGALLKSVFGIGTVYSVGLFRRETVLGTLVLILPKGKNIEHPEIIEIFAHQIGSLLAHTAHERKLQHEHSKLNALSVNSPDLLILVDHQYKVQYMNKVLPGFDMDKVIGDDVLNYVFPDYRQAYSAWLAEVFQSEKPLVREVKAVGQFGAAAYYKVTFTPVTQPGEASMVYIIATDITERKLAEEKIIRSNELFDLFFHQSLEGFFFMMLDEPIEWNNNIDKEKALDYIFSNQRVTKINDAMLQQYGAKKEDFLNRTPADLFSHDLNYGRKVWRKFLDEGKLHIDTEEKKLDGTEVVITGNYTCLYDDEGRITGHFGVQRDVTDKIKAEKELSQSEARLKQITGTINEVFYLYNILEKKYEFISPNCAELLGVNDAFFYQGNSFTKRYVYDEDQKRLFQANKDIDAGIAYEIEYRIWVKGELRWVNEKSFPIKNDEGLTVKNSGLVADITERRRREAEVAAINREIKNITNAVDASSLVSITDSRGTIVKVNQQFCEVSGYSEDELLGQNHRIINSGHHDKLFWRDLWQTITTGKVWKGEVKNRAKDGSEYWVSSVINPIFDEAGKITHYLSIRQDITVRKNAELEIEAVKQKLDSIFSEMDDVVWSVSLPDYKMLFMTPSAIKLYGIPHEEFMADNRWWEKIVYEDDKEVIHKIYKQLNDLGHFGEEYRIIARDGKVKWISNQGKVVRDSHGVPVRVDGYVRDISESKFAEQYLKESEANLKEAQSIAKLGRWELDLIFNRLHWSDSVFEIFEIDQEKFGATYEGFLNTIHPDDRQLVNDAYIHSLETKKPYEVVHRLQMKDSRIKWLKETCRTDYDAEGKALRSVGVVQDITESKLAEIELQNTKNFLAQTNQVARVGGWDFNNLTGEIIWSDIIREIHEVPYGFVPTYEQMANFYTPESWSNLEIAIQQTMTDGTPYDLELLITTAKNRLLWVRAIGNAEFKEGKCIRLFGVLQDIDTDKKNRLRIERSEESLNNAQQIAKMGSWELDVKTNEVIWTEELYKMYGFDPTAPPPPYTEHMKLFTPESWELLSTSLVQTSEKGIPYELELRTIRKDNSNGWMWVRGEAVFDKSHKIIALRGAAQDITDRKKAEEKIAKQNEFRKLIAEISTSFVRSDVETIDSIIDTTLKTCALHFDTDRSFLFQINHETETFTNTHDWHNADCPSMQHRVQDVPLHTYTWFAQKLAGQSIFVINDVETAPEEAAAEKAEWKEQRIKSILFIRFDINNRPAGVLGLASCTKAIEWNDDQISGLSVIANIISDGLSKYALEKGLMDAKEKADLANRAKSEFLANMSHEIRTPLNSILGFSEILLQSIKEPKASGHLQTILNSGRTLLSLINDLLDLAKIEAGKLEFQPDSIDINSMLAEVKEMFEAQASKKNIILKTELTSSFPKYILVDDVRLKQMLINLMGNAVKFTPDGGVSLRAGFLQLKGDDNRGILEITIADTGIGISENDIAAIFESFNQGTNRSTKNFGGTGLGLAITKRLVEAMGGSIRVKSQLGVGSEFTITLPNVHFVVNDTAKDKPNDTGELISAQFKPATLLVVDDVANNRDLVEAFLEGHNLNLVMAANGHEAVALAVQHKPDLILMDLRMPEMNGEEAAKLIKANKDLMHIPIVAFTASILAHEVLDDCFVSLLSKPVQGKMLFDELRKYLPYEPSASPEKEFAETKTETDLQNELSSHFTHLQQNFLERINTLARIMNVSDMEQLLVELNEYADRYQLTCFKAHLEQLSIVFQEFDLDKLSDRLAGLGKLISSVKDR